MNASAGATPNHEPRSGDDAVFELRDASFRYTPGAAPAVDALTLCVPRASFTALIGPNGSGKSTALRLLLGQLRPQSGDALFEGAPATAWRPDERARRIGVVAQHEEFPFPIRVHELVAMGRYPHLGPWRAERARDRAAVSGALVRCDVAPFADRPVTTLSGGELQRARLARALAQEPAVLVLDEPTASLDIAHEMTFFELLHALQRDQGTSIVVVTHNVNLAARYADRLALLDRGRLAAHGAPGDVLRRDIIEGVYGWPVHVYPHPASGRDAGAPQIVALAPSGAAHNPHGIDSRTTER
jgi:iron complex transport system ATP-binding protein